MAPTSESRVRQRIRISRGGGNEFRTARPDIRTGCSALARVCVCVPHWPQHAMLHDCVGQSEAADACYQPTCFQSIIGNFHNLTQPDGLYKIMRISIDCLIQQGKGEARKVSDHVKKQFNTLTVSQERLVTDRRTDTTPWQQQSIVRVGIIFTQNSV